MSECKELQACLDEAWRYLTRGVADKHAPARHPTLATVSPDGRPEARTVVLRAASRDDATLEVHTDTKTAKLRALESSPFAAFHIWIPRARLQLRLSTKVEIETGALVDDRWSNVPEGARVSYGTIPPPGTPIVGRDTYETPKSRDRFAVLICKIYSMDILHLREEHNRAVFCRDNGWQGTWVAP